MATKSLSDLFSALPRECTPNHLHGEAEGVKIERISCDSRQIQKGDLFLALKGTLVDGRKFVNAALENEASAVLLEGTQDDPIIADILTSLKPEYSNVPVFAVNRGRLACAHLPFVLAGHPEKKLSLIGVTGTNGKSTVACLIRQLLQGAGLETAELGTIGLRLRNDENYDTGYHTTPDPIKLCGLFERLVDDGITHVAMEVSSHAIHQERVAALPFEIGVFTNLSQDHLDYHASMKEYGEVKLSWLRNVLDNGGAIIANSQDDWGKKILAEARQDWPEQVRIGFGIKRGMEGAPLQADLLKSSLRGMEAVWTYQKEKHMHLLPLIGGYNMSNALAAAGAALAAGVPLGVALRELSWATAPPGRLERVRLKTGAMGLVDYAHTPDALENALAEIREVLGGNRKQSAKQTWQHGPDTSRNRINDKNEEEKTKGRLFVVFGAGGDRDKGKRPLMGAAVSKWADRIFVTSDNPRSENPEEIISQIFEGIDAGRQPDTILEPDREKAIQLAVKNAAEGDVIFVGGKGHEAYQEIHGEKFPFDDKDKLIAAAQAHCKIQPNEAH